VEGEERQRGKSLTCFSSFGGMQRCVLSRGQLWLLHGEHLYDAVEKALHIIFYWLCSCSLSSYPHISLLHHNKKSPALHT
jgi:hypothetical protein